MAGKGAYVLTQRAIMQKRQSYEQAKSYKNYDVMCITLVEMANTLPQETKCKGKQFGVYDGKPFREYLDNIIIKEMPRCILEKDVLEKTDKQAILQWLFKYGGLLERVIADYVNYFHRRGGTSL